MADVIDTNQGGGTLYPFKSYLNALSWTMDGTYKLYPSKYILLSGTQESIVSECDKNFDSSNSEVVEEYTKQRLLPFCFKDGRIQYVTTTDSDGNEVKTLDPQIEDPNNPDGKYIQQKLGYVGDIVCGGDINFLNHDSGQFETIVYASQSDQQACTYLTKFSLDEPDISDTIFVNVTGVENPNYPDKISFDGVLIFYNVYRKVGEFVDDLTDVYMADLPMAIYKLDTRVSLESNEEWLTRICMTFDANSGNAITTISDEDITEVSGKLDELITLAEEIDAQDAQYYTDLDEVRSYYNEFKNNRHVNVPYIQGNWWFVNGKKAGLYQMGDIVKDSIDEVRSDLDALEGWLGYNDSTKGSLPSSDLYNWILSIANNLTEIKETTANESDLEKLETWAGYGGDVGDYGSLFNWVFDLDSKIASTVSDISGLNIEGDDYISVDHIGNVFSLTFEADNFMKTFGENYLTVSNAENFYQKKISVDPYSPLTMTGTVISIDLSNYLQKGSLDGYITGADLADYVKLSYLEDNYYTKSEANAYYLTQTEAKSSYQTKLKWYEEGTSSDRTYGQIHNCEHAWMRCHFDTSDNMVYWANVDCDCYGDSGNTSPNSAQVIAGLTINDKEYANKQNEDTKRRRSLLHATEDSVALRYDYQNYNSSIEGHYYSWLQLGKNYFHVSNSLGIALCIGDVPENITGAGVGIETNGVYCKIPGESKYKRMLTNNDSYDVELGQSLTVDGTTTLKDLLTVNAGAVVNGEMTLGNNLVVDGTTILNDLLTVNADVSISGKLTVDGNTFLKSNVDIDNNLTIGGNLILSGDATLSGDLYFNNGIYLTTTNNSSGIYFINESGARTRLYYNSDGNLYFGNKSLT